MQLQSVKVDKYFKHVHQPLLAILLTEHFVPFPTSYLYSLHYFTRLASVEIHF